MTQGDKLSPNPAGAGPNSSNNPSGPLASSLPAEQYLAAIIAHEMSNPFTALAGRVDLMRNRKDLPAQLTRDLDAMKSANDRIERLLTNVKAFSQREGPPPRPVELLPLLRNAVETFRTTDIGSKTEVSIQPSDTPTRTLADPSMLEMAIAATIEALVTRHTGINAVDIRLNTNDIDEEVSILFADQGPEYSEEQSARVFHPFGGKSLCKWRGAITLAYSYYIIRAWGGTYRFRRQGRDTITEMCLALQLG